MLTSTEYSVAKTMLRTSCEIDDNPNYTAHDCWRDIFTALADTFRHEHVLSGVDFDMNEFTVLCQVGE